MAASTSALAGTTSTAPAVEPQPCAIDPHIQITPFRWSVCVLDRNDTFSVLIKSPNSIHLIYLDEETGISIERLDAPPKYQVRSQVSLIRSDEGEDYLGTMRASRGERNWSLFFGKTYDFFRLKNSFKKQRYPSPIQLKDFHDSSLTAPSAHFWVADEKLIAHHENLEGTTWHAIGGDPWRTDIQQLMISTPEEPPEIDLPYMPQLASLNIQSFDGLEACFTTKKPDPKDRQKPLYILNPFTINRQREFFYDLRPFQIRHNGTIYSWEEFGAWQLEELQNRNPTRYDLLHRELGWILDSREGQIDLHQATWIIEKEPFSPARFLAEYGGGTREITHSFYVDLDGTPIEIQIADSLTGEDLRECLHLISLEESGGNLHAVFLLLKRKTVFSATKTYTPLHEVLLSAFLKEDGSFVFFIEGAAKAKTIIASGGICVLVDTNSIDFSLFDLSQCLLKCCPLDLVTTFLQRFEYLEGVQYPVYLESSHTLLRELTTHCFGEDEGSPLVFEPMEIPPLDTNSFLKWERKLPLLKLLDQSFIWYHGETSVSFRKQGETYQWFENQVPLDDASRIEFRNRRGETVPVSSLDPQFVPLFKTTHLIEANEERIVFEIQERVSAIDGETPIQPNSWAITLATKGYSGRGRILDRFEPHTSLFLETPDSTDVIRVHLTKEGLQTEQIAAEEIQGKFIRRSEVTRIFPSRQFIEKILGDLDDDIQLRNDRNCVQYGLDCFRVAGRPFPSSFHPFSIRMNPYAFTATGSVLPRASGSFLSFMYSHGPHTITVDQLDTGSEIHYFAYLAGIKDSVFEDRSGLCYSIECKWKGDHFLIVAHRPNPIWKKSKKIYPEEFLTWQKA